MRPFNIRLRLALAFALLIAALIIVGWQGATHLRRLNAQTQDIFHNHWHEAQISREAFRLSNLNNRLTLLVFLLDDPEEIQRLLTQRAANTGRISQLVSTLEAQMDDPEEMRLLAVVKATRTPYVESYKRALAILVTEHKRDDGRRMMTQDTLPLLIAYHDAWNDLYQFQSNQIEAAVLKSETDFAAGQREFLSMVGIAGLITIMIAGFTVWRTGRDIADRERAEASLAQTSALLETLLANSVDYIYFKDRESRFIRCSRALAQHFGKSGPDELIGRTDFDFYLEDRARPAYEDEQHILRTGEPIIGKLEKGAHTDGHVAWVLTSKMPWRDNKGNIIGTFGVSRDVTALKEAEIALAETSSLLETLLANCPDYIYFKDRQSHFVRCSRSLARMFHISDPRELAGKTDFDFFREEHARPAFDDEQEIIRTGQPIINKREKETHPDGRTTWALTTKLPWCDSDGNIIGTFGISKDVTVIKEAEARLEQVHKQLLDTSRQAGMAEVATSVLHNVGNVLNSVNTSASIIADKLRASKVSGIARITSLFEQHRNDLAGFLASDGRMEQVLNYLRTLNQHLDTEQRFVLTELEDLTQNIEHIKEIVAMQQSYARVSGITETLNVADLVEDSLRMNSGALARHGVTLVREFAPVPFITMEKHKVLQILVNLIRNAKYACDDSGQQEKRMTVRIANGGGCIKISVADNGVGIAPENLTRIFSHGFTTRTNGHGFGLHSGALAAKEMGGALRAHSDGPGKGATFTLELPVQHNEQTL